MVGSIEQIAERLLPTGAERWNIDHRLQLVGVAIGQVEQRIDVGDAECVRADPGTDDFVAGLDSAFGDDPEVEAGPVMCDEQRRQLRFAEPHTHPETGDPRLGDLEFRLADAVAVADADLVVGETVDGEVLTELTVFEVIAAELLLPIGV